MNGLRHTNFSERQANGGDRVVASHPIAETQKDQENTMNGTTVSEASESTSRLTPADAGDSPVVARSTAAPVAKADLDLEGLRLSQNFGLAAKVKKVVAVVPIRKPSPQEFFRVHPGSDHRALVAMIELKDDRAIYVVKPELVADIVREVTVRLLVLAINTAGVVFLWPLRQPREDGRFDDWGSSAIAAAENAEQQWTRMTSTTGSYQVEVAQGNLAEPKWPDLTFAETVKIAFKGKVIDSLDHPVLRRLRGEE
jgi:hypothetical protein